MILSVFLNSFLHETGERGEDVDGRVNLLVVKLTIDEDLALSNVASQIGDGMGDIVVLDRRTLTGIDRMGI